MPKADPALEEARKQIKTLERRCDEQDQELDELRRQNDMLAVAGSKAESDLERFEQEAIVIVPTEGETSHEMMRRRIRNLEVLVDRLRDMIVEPPILQKRRVALELANKDLERLVGDILAAATEQPPRTPKWMLTWIADRCRDALGTQIARMVETSAKDKMDISAWATATCELLTKIAEGAPHSGGCACEGCKAEELLHHAEELGIVWKDPTAEAIAEVAKIAEEVSGS